MEIQHHNQVLELTQSTSDTKGNKQQVAWDRLTIKIKNAENILLKKVTSPSSS
jgi:hypothetical protein